MVNETHQRIIYVAGDLLATSLAWFVFTVIRFFNVVQGVKCYPTFWDFLSVKPVWMGQYSSQSS